MGGREGQLVAEEKRNRNKYTSRKSALQREYLYKNYRQLTLANTFFKTSTPGDKTLNLSG